MFRLTVCVMSRPTNHQTVRESRSHSAEPQIDRLTGRGYSFDCVTRKRNLLNRIFFLSAYLISLHCVQVMQKVTLYTKRFLVFFLLNKFLLLERKKLREMASLKRQFEHTGGLFRQWKEMFKFLLPFWLVLRLHVELNGVMTGSWQLWKPDKTSFN